MAVDVAALTFSRANSGSVTFGASARPHPRRHQRQRDLHRHWCRHSGGVFLDAQLPTLQHRRDRARGRDGSNADPSFISAPTLPGVAVHAPRLLDQRPTARSGARTSTAPRSQSFITGATPRRYRRRRPLRYWTNGGNGTIGRARPRRHRNANEKASSPAPPAPKGGGRRSHVDRANDKIARIGRADLDGTLMLTRSLSPAASTSQTGSGGHSLQVDCVTGPTGPTGATGATGTAGTGRLRPARAARKGATGAKGDGRQRGRPGPPVRWVPPAAGATGPARRREPLVLQAPTGPRGLRGRHPAPLLRW